MKTKKVRVFRVPASGSTTATTTTLVTLPRAPWDVEPDPEPEQVEEVEGKKREPRHLGTYKKR